MTLANDSSPVVLKFGGTSVRDADAMLRVVSITERERGNRPVVVTSACAGVTDLLLECARLCGEGDKEEARRIASLLRHRHIEIMEALQAPPLWSCEAQLAELLDEIDRLIEGVVLLQELTPRTVDAFAGYGERLSSHLLVTAFRASGWRAALADSRRFIVTDGEHGNARPIMAEIDARTKNEIMSQFGENEVVVAQGFIGCTLDGIQTTIGRGGSDHTGALVGAALGAREIQIWTDVSGILTADPRAVPEARVVPRVTFSEARELAYFGAKVLHPDTIIPAVERAIPVVIRNSMRPEDAGTEILPDGSPIPGGIHSITAKKGTTILKLAARRSPAARPVESATATLAEQGIAVQCAVFAEARGIVAVESKAFDDIALAALESELDVEVMEGMAILCLIGSRLREEAGVLTAPMAALDRIPLVFIAAGSSDHSVLVGIPESRVGEALAALHRRLFEEGNRE